MPEATLRNFSAAVGNLNQTAPLETLADDAFASMSKLRDLLVVRNDNMAACLVDDAISALQCACREFVK